MKRILFNALQAEEQRVAIVDGQFLFDLDIEYPSRNQKKGNIYKGVISRVEPSLEAAFVEYGSARHGFLPLKEVAAQYLQDVPHGERPNIKQVFREGQEIIFQVEKEERGTKGAALTTHISLAGRYLVYMPNSPQAGGISRKIESDDRHELRAAMDQLQLPDGAGVIARTVAAERSTEELQWDLDYLAQLWEAVVAASAERKGPFLIYQESNIISRVIRDYLRDDISELIIDSPEVYEEAHQFMQQLLPQSLPKLKLYEDKVPLFTRYQIEHQIETAHQREVPLRSGGGLVIDHTEALTTVDINSARATQGSDIEETALKTNLEAADEVARQLRLRDLGGLIVIDFIDMNSQRNQREVENRLRDALKSDRARVQVGRLSRFGLLEMSRQRLRPSLTETSHITCPRCDGQGTIRTVESSAMQVLRLIEEEALKERTARITVQVPVPVATYLLNEKRSVLASLDERLAVGVMILPTPALETPHYDIQRTRVQDMNLRLSETPSYELTPVADDVPDLPSTQTAPTAEAPAVRPVTRSAPPPRPTPKVENGVSSDEQGNDSWLSGLWKMLTGQAATQPEPAEQAEKPAARSRSRGGRGRSSRPRRQGTGGDQARARTQRTGSRSANAEPPAAGTAHDTAPAAKSEQQGSSGGGSSRRGGRGRSRGGSGRRSGNSPRTTEPNGDRSGDHGGERTGDRNPERPGDGAGRVTSEPSNIYNLNATQDAGKHSDGGAVPKHAAVTVTPDPVGSGASAPKPAAGPQPRPESAAVPRGSDEPATRTPRETRPDNVSSPAQVETRRVGGDSESAQSSE